MIGAATRAKIEEARARYPAKRGALLPALHLIQAEHGYIDPENAEEVAQLLEITPIEVMEVISFYNMFYDRPGPRHRVHVCTNLSCSLRGSRALLAQLEAHLGVKVGEPTPDGRLVLGHEECLGACANAPMMRVDDTYHEDLDAVTARTILDSLE